MVESLVLAFALSVIRLSAPMFIAGMGNMYCERVGVLNLGAEGMMVSGAFAAVLGSYLTGNPWIGVLMGIYIHREALFNLLLDKIVYHGV